MTRPLVSPGPQLTAEQRERYARPMLLPGIGEEGQRRFLAARVLVIGAGGLGSPALLYLAGQGIGHLGIVDSDVLESSNLHRQVIHAVAAIGRAKVDSAAERVRGLNPDVEVAIYRERLTQERAVELFGEYDVVVDATDNFATRYLINAAATETGVPEVWGSVLGATGQVSTFWSGAAAAAHGTPDVRLTDLHPAPPADGVIPVGAASPVIGPLTGMVGSLMAGEVTKLVAGYGEPLLGRVAYLDTAAAEFRDIQFKK
ncbi:HesA/MoeB/ThiF family protein [Neoactinobaculum massilliense]|uniref:HesA/MoeB/ThiF family protein n=1 Tax=Neoactinobaculum massilliense TaxID=2364794 RepID=UPI000F538B30|nr:HesA/MoeB/ThiF family protein [Neoactinobaculum massilliense]